MAVNYSLNLDSYLYITTCDSTPSSYRCNVSDTDLELPLNRDLYAYSPNDVSKVNQDLKMPGLFGLLAYYPQGCNTVATEDERQRLALGRPFTMYTCTNYNNDIITSLMKKVQCNNWKPVWRDPTRGNYRQCPGHEVFGFSQNGFVDDGTVIGYRFSMYDCVNARYSDDCFLNGFIRQ